MKECDFEIKYKKGKENSVADALSRLEINTHEKTIHFQMIAEASDVASRAAEEIDEMIDDDMITVHTSDEDLIFSLPVAEKNMHAFNYSIILKSENDYDIKMNKDKLKIQYIVK